MLLCCYLYYILYIFKFFKNLFILILLWILRKFCPKNFIEIIHHYIFHNAQCLYFRMRSSSSMNEHKINMTRLRQNKLFDLFISLIGSNITTTVPWWCHFVNLWFNFPGLFYCINIFLLSKSVTLRTRLNYFPVQTVIILQHCF